MFGLGGIRKLNDGWIAKQAAHEAQLNLAREHADRAELQAKAEAAHQQPMQPAFNPLRLRANLPSAPVEVTDMLDTLIDEFHAQDEQRHATYKCGGTLR